MAPWEALGIYINFWKSYVSHQNRIQTLERKWWGFVSFVWADKILKSIINVNRASAISRAARSPLFLVLHYLRVNLFTPAVAMATSSGRWHQMTPCLSCAVTLSLLVLASWPQPRGDARGKLSSHGAAWTNPQGRQLTSHRLTTGGWETGQSICCFAPQVNNSDSHSTWLLIGSRCTCPHDQMKIRCTLPFSWQSHSWLLGSCQALTLVPQDYFLQIIFTVTPALLFFIVRENAGWDN